MASLEDIRKERLKKLELLRNKGINPYPSTSGRDTSIDALVDGFDSFDFDKKVTISGRIMAIREHGGSAFIDVYDGTGRIQGFLTEDSLGEAFAFFKETVDIGDFIDIRGTPMMTKREEKSLSVSSWQMMSKSLRPLPEKWHGLKDEEERLRRRYLDILFNKDVRDMVEKQSRFWKSVRTFLRDKGFTEVETPALEVTAGGANAKPFKTHHDALDMDLFLRISAGELWQKELLVAGFPKTFELGRIFRNEGMDREHLQDYSQVEFYWAYADYEDGMRLTEELFRHVAKETWGTQKFEIDGHKVDLSKKWERYDYSETIKKMSGIDPLDTTLEEVENKLSELGIRVDKGGWNLPKAMDALWKHYRRQISGPGFLIHVPKALSPLAKSHPENPTVTERFQTIIGGTELSNGFSELNDPVDQRERFARQQEMREGGDEEAHPIDEGFLEAMEYGMPPACGFGMSVRVFYKLHGISARESQIFPLMRPQE